MKSNGWEERRASRWMCGSLPLRITPGTSGQRRKIQGGPLLSAQCRLDHPPSPEGEEGGYPPSWPIIFFRSFPRRTQRTSLTSLRRPGDPYSGTRGREMCGSWRIPSNGRSFSSVHPIILPEDLSQKLLEADPEEAGRKNRHPPWLQERPPSLKEVEKRYVLKVLQETKGNKKKASEILGIDRTTLYRILEKE